MEKINALIEKLQELKNSGADLSALSYYVQLLQAEVLHERNRQHQQRVQATQGNIAVIMPQQSMVTNTVPVTTAAQTTTLPSNKTPEPPVAEKPLPIAPEIAAKAGNPVIATPAPANEEEDINTRAARLSTANTINNIISSEDINTRAAKAQDTTPQPAAIDPVPPATPEPVAAAVPPATDLVPPKPTPVVTAQPIPTLAASQPAAEKPRPATLFDDIPATNGHTDTPTRELRKDLNELAGNNGQSINDRLRQQQVEVAQKLGDMPIQDLRAAIGINDKYQFIQELFRGDRDLYERSIKTINECGNLQEADYWIQREIKIIQGWQDDHHLVQHFYSLLKKRFS
ncbi:MAG: hypothetical protein J7623_05285 [Chitinophaga sp.]|uniref:hypothetical protein n=1 Tax=Chitinophaga sp. TaxID=1869181 RepID=UPI001B16C71C|nr:hypothetical protein [Chitinophaga sp.]MBO9728032.1 hypothetical protein [Chitinophaga sp.]